MSQKVGDERGTLEMPDVCSSLAAIAMTSLHSLTATSSFLSCFLCGSTAVCLRLCLPLL